MLSNTVFTCHDAVWVLKNLSVLKYIHKYQMDVEIFRDDKVEKNHHFYLLVKENDLMEKCAFKIDVIKRTMKFLDYKSTKELVERDKLASYKTTITKRKMEEEEID